MAKREPHWVKLFLRGLARSGNVRMAAEEAGVDFTTAYGRRKRHADFAVQWDEALKAQGEAATAAAADGDGDGDGEGEAIVPAAQPDPLPETVTRPDGKIIKGSDARWSKRAETSFLAELTLSANVKRAAAAAGFSPAAVYKRRLKDKQLAAAWDAAIETGKARVQAYLVEAASRTFDPDELPISNEDAPIKVSVSEAINIAKLKGGPSLILPGGSGADPGDGQFITQSEFEQARERVRDRVMRLQIMIGDEEFRTGCCHNCGQELRGPPGESLKSWPQARVLLYAASRGIPF